MCPAVPHILSPLCEVLTVSGLFTGVPGREKGFCYLCFYVAQCQPHPQPCQHLYHQARPAVPSEPGPQQVHLMRHLTYLVFQDKRVSLCNNPGCHKACFVVQSPRSACLCFPNIGFKGVHHHCTAKPSPSEQKEMAQ